MIYLKITKPNNFRGCPAFDHDHICKGDAAMSCLPSTKVCTKCKVEKPISEFHKSKKYKSGIRSVCKTCRAEAHKANLPAIRKQRKRHYEKNKEKLCDYQKEYRKNNEELVKARKKKYREVYKEQIAYKKKTHYELNKDKIKVCVKRYSKTPSGKFAHKKANKKYNKTPKAKDIFRKSSHVRRALLKNATIEDFSPTEIFERDNYVCQLCGCKTSLRYRITYHPKRTTLDHIIPLSLGGDHSRMNTQCACHKCNIEKSNTGTGDQLRMFG